MRTACTAFPFGCSINLCQPPQHRETPAGIHVTGDHLTEGTVKQATDQRHADLNDCLSLPSKKKPIPALSTPALHLWMKKKNNNFQFLRYYQMPLSCHEANCLCRLNNYR